METILPALASGAVSAALAAFGCYVAITNRLTKMETTIEHMAATMEKHNQVIERTYKLESDLHTAFKHIDMMRDDIHKLEDVKIGGTQ